MARRPGIPKERCKQWRVLQRRGFFFLESVGIKFPWKASSSEMGPCFQCNELIGWIMVNHDNGLNQCYLAYRCQQFNLYRCEERLDVFFWNKINPISYQIHELHVFLNWSIFKTTGTHRLLHKRTHCMEVHYLHQGLKQSMANSSKLPSIGFLQDQNNHHLWKFGQLQLHTDS